MIDFLEPAIPKIINRYVLIMREYRHTEILSFRLLLSAAVDSSMARAASRSIMAISPAGSAHPGLSLGRAPLSILNQKIHQPGIQNMAIRLVTH